MKKLQKIFGIVIILMTIMMLATTVVYADEASYDPSSILDGKTANVSTDKITNIGANIVKIISTIGSIASIIVLIILGLKYMMGSAEEKAEYKKTLLPYIIGASLVFAASGIAGIIYSFTNNLA